MWVPLLEGAGTGLTKFRWYRVVVPGGVAAFKRSEREKGSEEETTCKQRSGLCGVVSEPCRSQGRTGKQLPETTGETNWQLRQVRATLEQNAGRGRF